MKAVSRAREQVASLINANKSEIYFTSGATESNNLAIQGVVSSLKAKKGHIVTCKTEHKAVLDTCKHLETAGFRVTYLDVDREGLISLRDVEEAIGEDTVLVSLMAANNEIGVIHPICEIGSICKEHGVLFHTDATQALGKVPIDVEQMHVDLISISGHKIYGPKGIGALYISEGCKEEVVPQMIGGGQERGLRSGTQNVPGIVGLGMACEILDQVSTVEQARLQKMRDLLLSKFCDGLDDFTVNGSMTKRLSGNLNITIRGVDAPALLGSLEDIAISSGSACNANSSGPSHVLQALGNERLIGRCTLRFGLGRFNTFAHVEEVASRVIREVKVLRSGTKIKFG